MLVVLGP